jgi:hypothetical protein
MDELGDRSITEDRALMRRMITNNVDGNVNILVVNGLAINGAAAVIRSARALQDAADYSINFGKRDFQILPHKCALSANGRGTGKTTGADCSSGLFASPPS